MPSTYSNIKIQLMATGENNTTWGNVTNINLGTALEEAIVGSADVTFASGNVTLTLTDTNASQTARHVRLRCTGVTGGSTRDLIVPAIEKPYLVQNDCLNSIVVKNATGTGVTVPAGKTMWVYNDGTNVVDAVNHLSSLTLGTALPVGQGGTGASTFTANGIIYGNTTSALLATAAGTTGQVLVGNTGGAPSWATLTGIGVTSFSGGTTGLTPASPTTGAITLAGTLGVANGGTGTATAFTAGSVVFAGASGVYSQDNANLFWDNANDRLGIGTATPAGKLDVVGSAYIGSNSNNSFFIDSDASLVTVGAAGRTSFSTSALRFLTSDGSAALERMRITSAGNVGVGTAFPSTVYRQTINGDGSSILGGLSLRNNGTETLVIGNITATNDVDSEIWNPRNGFLRFATNNAERMRIDASGNVGIGTSSPGTRLDVSGGDTYRISRVSTATGGIIEMGLLGQSIIGIQSLTNLSNFQSLILNPNGGDVGIGTSSPATTLHVQSATGQIRVQNTTSGTALIGFRNSTTSDIPWVGTGGDDIRIITQSAERVRINSAGNVGIGTSAPANRLQVSYTSTAPSLSSDAGSGLSLVGSSTLRVNIGSDPSFPFGGWIQASNGSGSSFPLTLNPLGGNVGVGTSVPAYVLDVLGANNTQLSIRTPDLAAGSIASPLYQSVRFFGYSGAERARITGIDTASNNVNGQLAFWTGQGGSMIEAMRIDAVGNVGIGTTTPTSGRLVVDAGASSTAAVFNSTSDTYIQLQNSGTNGFYIQSGSSAAYLWNQLNTPLLFATNNVERMRITGGGNVGIGTSTPAVSLEISSTFDEILRITGTGSPYASWYTGTTRRGYIQAQAGSFTVASDLGLPLLLSTNVTERMRITDTGNVGIGTASPSALLDVKSQINVTNASNLSFNALRGSRFGYSTTYNALVVGATSGNTTVCVNVDPVSNPGSLFTGLGNEVLFRDGVTFITPNAGNTDYNLDIFSMKDGSVGIGTATPDAKLEVAGGLDGVYNANVLVSSSASSAKLAFNPNGVSSAGIGSASGGLIFYANGANAERMRIASDGNVGIGTTSPGYKLEVRTDGASDFNWITSFNNTAAGAYGAGFIARSGSNFAYFYMRGDGLAFVENAGNNGLGFATNGIERMRVTNAGDVGIGTSSPTGKLDVRGNFNNIWTTGVANSTLIGAVAGISNGYEISKDTSDNITHYWRKGDNSVSMILTSAGNVGIGTSSPPLKFVVSNGGAAGLEIDPTAVASAPVIQSYNRSGAAYTQLTYSALQHIWQVSGSETMRITSSGNVGIGTATPASNLEVFSSPGGEIRFGNVSGIGRLIANGTATYIGSYSNHPVVFQTDQVEKMRIDTSGNLLVGTTATGGATTNTARVTGGIFSTFNSSPSIPHNTATTVATLPSGDGVYLVTTAMVNSGSPSDYNETAIISVSQSAAVVSTIVNAVAMSITVSGLNVQLTHGQGTTQTCQVSILRML